MRREHTIAVIIPALNEAPSIGRVIDAIPPWVDDVVVADNGSTDGTARVAREHGARVVDAPRPGYGSACLAAMATLDFPDIVVFLDGDYSDHPEEMHLLVDPILNREFDFVVGSRVRGNCAPGALTPQARFGNWLATLLIRIIWGVPYTDLGPFRAIRFATLQQLGMRDPDYGWTVEMQIKAALQGVPAGEVPVSYRPRIGQSKVAGTLRGVWGAGTKILGHIFAAALSQRIRRRTDMLVLFTRWPEPGSTKTRLIPELGEEGAAELQREMTEHTVHTLRALLQRAHLEVRYAGGERRDLRAWLGGDLEYAPQGEGDLGARLAQAFDDHFALHYGKVVIVGADCPGLTAAHLGEALEALDHEDLVLGPAEDGGYYLIGLHLGASFEDLAPLFADIAWGTGSVREETLARAADLGLGVHELAVLRDVDTPEDLGVWHAVRTTQTAPVRRSD